MPIDGEIGPIYLPSASPASVYSSRTFCKASGLSGSAAFTRCTENLIEGIFGCPQTATLRVKTIRVGPESSYRIAELSQHQAD